MLAGNYNISTLNVLSVQEVLTHFKDIFTMFLHPFEIVMQPYLTLATMLFLTFFDMTNSEGATGDFINIGQLK